jgi:hypothetical protein
MSKKKNVTQWENERTYQMYLNRLRDYALALFEWKGLPDTVNERFLELTMFQEGKILFFKDEDMGGFLALPFAYSALNVYREPTAFNAYSINYQKEYDHTNAVPIWCNFTREPIHWIIEEYAKRLYFVERALDLNIRQQKFPFLILGEESQRLTLMNAYEKWEGNEPFIFGYKTGFDKDAFQVLNTPVPYVADKLMEYKHNLWNEAMTFLGIGNAKQDKRERLVSDEVAANDEQIESAREVMLKARQIACKQINTMFGLNISVNYRLRELQQEEETEKVGEENVNPGN